MTVHTQALDVQHLTVSAPGGTPVLKRVSLSVAPGECLALVGESGSGKSVLARTLLGLTQGLARWRVTSDEFDVAGRDLRSAPQREWRRLRGKQIGLVLQDALQSLDPLRTIGAEVGEALAIRRVRRRDRREQALVALERAGLPEPRGLLRRRSGELSGGMRQRALIASALVGNPSLIVADEPTTALDPANSTRILELLRRQCDEGRAVLLISHDLRAVKAIADRVAVLDKGELVEVGATGEIMRRPQHPATRRLVAAIPECSPSSGQPATTDPSRALDTPVVVEAVAATREYRGGAGVHSASLALRRGEAVGLVGESGAGKTTLARLIVGAERPDSGEVRVAPGAKVRLIPQDPLSTFDPRWRVERIIASSIGAESQHTPAELLTSVGLDPALLPRHPSTLSGGQRQRVAIARALAADPDVLVCDEPVSALDASTQAGILELLRGLQRRGVALVFVSHDLDAVRTVCDRVIKVSEGRIDGEREQAQTTSR